MSIPQGYFCSFSTIWCSKAVTEIKEKQVYVLQSWVAERCRLQKSDTKFVVPYLWLHCVAIPASKSSIQDVLRKRFTSVLTPLPHGDTLALAGTLQMRPPVITEYYNSSLREKVE